MQYLIISKICFLFLLVKLVLVIKNHQLKRISFFVIAVLLILMYLGVSFGSKFEIFPKELVILLTFKTPDIIFILFYSIYFIMLIIKKTSPVILNSILISLLIYALFQMLIGFPFPEFMRIE